MSTHRLRPLAALTFVVALATATPAQATGIAYEYGQVHPSIGGPAGLLVPPTPYTAYPLDSVGFRFTSFGHAITLLDSSGILLAVLGEAGAEESARAEAEREAIRHGATQGDAYRYSVREQQFVPGLQSSLRVAFGSGHGAELSFDDKTFVDAPDLDTGFLTGTFHTDFPGFKLYDIPGLVGVHPDGPAWLNLGAAVGVDVMAGQYTVKGTRQSPTGAQTIDRKELAISWPLLLTLDFNPLPGLHLQPRVGYDLIGGLDALFKVGRQGYTYGVGLKYAPIDAMYVTADMRTLSSSFSDHTFDDQLLSAGAGVGF